MKSRQRPEIGVGAIILKDGKVLLGLRKGSHGAGTWSFPGGHLEFGESLEECATREVFEETGVSLKNIRRGTFTNDIFESEQRHYVTLYVIAEYDSGEPTVKEPNKCERWAWFSWDQLPHPLFLPLRNLLKQGFRPG